jgi:adenylate cyclase
MSDEDVGRLCRALGFADLAEDRHGYTDADVGAFGEVARLASDGAVDLDAVVTMVRPMGHLISRLGAAQVSAVSSFRERPPADREHLPRDDPQIGVDRLLPVLEQLVIHAWRRHLVAAATAALPTDAVDVASLAQAVGFIDISRYTAMSRRIDWAELTSLLDHFEGCVFDQVGDGGGRVVKTLGDEVLFVASEPAAAAEIALSVVEASGTDPDMPAVHAGIAYGPLLERAGDVFGATVDNASRVTGLAREGTVLVDGACRTHLEGDRRFLAQRRRRRPARGYASVPIYRLRRAGPRP